VELSDQVFDITEGPALTTHLHQFFVLIGNLHQHFPFARIMTARFFHLNIFPCLQTHDGRRRMPMVGGGNRQSVKIFLFEQFSSSANTFCGISTEFPRDQRQKLDKTLMHVFYISLIEPSFQVPLILLSHSYASHLLLSH